MKFTKKRWTTKEINILTNMWIQEYKISDIAKVLGRKEPVVRAKASALRRSLKNGKEIFKFKGKHPNYKLKPEQIPGIRKDDRSLRLIAEEYNVSQVTIFKIKNGETWKDA